MRNLKDLPSPSFVLLFIFSSFRLHKLPDSYANRVRLYSTLGRLISPEHIDPYRLDPRALEIIDPSYFSAGQQQTRQALILYSLACTHWHVSFSLAAQGWPLACSFANTIEHQLCDCFCRVPEAQQVQPDRQVGLPG